MPAAVKRRRSAGIERKSDSGSLGKSDSENKRACALLEYAVRDDHNNNSNSNNNNIEISMAQLAKAALMKLKDFREYHEKIGNFRIDPPSTTVTTKKRTTRGVTAAAVTKTTTTKNPQNRRSSNNSSSIVLKKSSIPFLAIQLGAFVPNSSDVAKRAQDYFQDVIELLKKPSNKGGGVHGLRDIQRNQFSYEAACFYLIATSGRGHDRSNSNSKVRRRSKTGDDDDEDDIERQLDLSTFIDVIKAPSQFQTVLGYVKELREDIESTLSSSRRSSSENETKSTTASRKRSRKEASESSEATIAARKRNNSHDVSGENPPSAPYNEKQSNDFSDNQRRRHSRPNPVFDEWKKKVLVEACEDAKETMKKAKKYESCENDNEADRILDFAVRKILAGNGML
ncbi:hypothetical protein FRACYDRAFT_241993 [Fragilariopsis cylindrus CCMP1102]|uniref:Uncharacterized protein n=1 Tax=Fragilariopsis cylindrus CCMP1102 TaxID=635003 RepID=A0A1E7F693_9STRA|nr:hypothetical protein FRACYDRAFT_241993 [Fragilariopsis cylindrus CCMP1102]|eukprot:OEU13649.1 hypothetical protein FRACYDRAFT_241993 [Fragilariopsis cylindrus CCMP1102]